MPSWTGCSVRDGSVVDGGSLLRRRLCPDRHRENPSGRRIGADLDGNASAVGASANVVVLGIADRAGHHISFWQFTRYGLIVAVVSVALAVPYLWLRFFAFQ
jgi:hypothetical protein